MEVSVSTPYITQQIVAKCIAAFESTSDDSLIVTAECEIKEVDIQLIAYFILFKKLRPELDIILDLKENRGEDIVRKLRQYMMYAFLAVGDSVFSLKAKKQTMRISQTKGTYSYDPEWYVSSGSFLPLLVIDKKDPRQFDIYFEKGLNSLLPSKLQELPDGIPLLPSSDDMANLCIKTIRGEVNLNDPEKSLLNLGRIAFYRALGEAKILHLFFDADGNASKLTSDQSQRFYREIEDIFIELRDMPLIYHLIYSFLLSSDLLPKGALSGKTNAEPYAEFRTRLWTLWYFTKDLARGLRELAVNIREHADPAFGVIACKKYNEADWLNLKNARLETGNILDEYAAGYCDEKKIPASALSLIDINVIDPGKLGVTRTLLKSCKKFLDEIIFDNVKEDIQSDITNIENGNIAFEDFLSPEKNSLRQQTKRSIAHIGLLTLSSLINKNFGLVRASTWKNDSTDGIRETFMLSKCVKKAQAGDLIPWGTNYHIVLPINPAAPYQPNQPMQLPVKSTPGEVRDIEEMIDFETIQLVSDRMTPALAKDKKYLITLIPQKLTIADESDVYPLWEICNSMLQNIADAISKNGKRDKPILVFIDLAGIKMNGSQLFRLMGAIEETHAGLSPSYINVPSSLFLELRKLNTEFTVINSASSFWGTNTLTLIYHYTEVGSERFYFTDILWGQTQADNDQLNLLVKRTHFNATTLVNFDEKACKRNGNTVDVSFHQAFTNHNVLLPLDLLLESEQEITLFEHNSLVLLKNKLLPNKFASPPSGTLQGAIEQLTGYKIPNSHFRIGSKIHIPDFFYAKRFFQNSFFASRLAFLAARFIVMEHRQNASRMVSEGLTLLGYGLYSSLLLSMVERFVKAAWKNQFGLIPSGINHGLVEDAENLKYLKDNQVHKHVIIIVPIASTFSTAIKIEEFLRERHQDRIIMAPHINILFVSNTGKDAELEENFGWEQQNTAQRTVTVRALYDSKRPNREQKYFLTLNTRWQNVTTCQFCFPDNATAERPLYDTDRTAVTPALIFDRPKGRIISSEDLERAFTISPQSLQYGHHERNNNHFHYYINSEEFFNDNEEEVISWLTDIKGNSQAFNRAYNEIDHVLILASGHHTNATFVTLVNRTLFANTATILHYDRNNEFVQNFSLIYGDELASADKIFFVDDALNSGSTFEDISSFLQHTLAMKEIRERPLFKPKDGITACIFLLNNASDFAFRQVCNNLCTLTAPGESNIPPIFSFANFHLPTSVDTNGNSPLHMEQQRYLSLERNTFLDSLKVHFFKQANKLSYATNRRPERGKTSPKFQRHLGMLYASHCIYQYFVQTNNDVTHFDTIEAFMADLLKHTGNSFIGAALLKGPTAASAEDYVLKVLTQYPFVQYRALQNQVFKWVLIKLDNQVKKVHQEITNDQFSYPSFNDLKFLMRRAGLLNSNYLILEDSIAFIQHLYSNKGLPKFFAKPEQSSPTRSQLNFFTSTSTEQITTGERSKLKDFAIFYAAQIKELLHRNEARSITLEKQLNKLDYNRSTPAFKQVIRILREENIVLIQKAYEHLSRSTAWRDLCRPENEHNILNGNTAPIVKLLDSHAIRNHHLFKSLKTYFSTTSELEENGEYPASFLNYLWVLNRISDNEGYENVSLEKKTEQIMNKLKEIVIPADATAYGAFLIVKHGQEDPQDNRQMHDQKDQRSYFIAYNKNNTGQKEIDETSWDATINPCIRNFINGIKANNEVSNKTLIEFSREEDGSWKDIYSIHGDNGELQPPQAFLSGKYKRLLLIRLSRREAQKEKSQGVVGFYYHSSEHPDIPTNVLRVKYLLLLRSAISDFIEAHHENDEFREWRAEKESKRLAFLAGHGKEMLLDVVWEHKGKYRDIVLNQQNLQMIAILKNHIADLGSNTEYKKLFENYYHVRGASGISPDKYRKKIEEMVNDLFEYPEIENTVYVKVLPSTKMANTCGSDFSFSEDILDIICFELIINAKKNRWLQLPGEAPADFKNEVGIEIRIIDNGKQRELEIVISNTCPEMERHSYRDLQNQMSNVKKEDISGTNLIKSLLKNFELGEIKYEQQPWHGGNGIYRMTATVTVREMLHSDNMPDTNSPL